jgi:hypothetical protein
MGKLDAPDNITPIFLPSRAPELNAVENVCQYLGQNWLANTVFENYRDRRRRMRRLAKAHRSTRNDHVHRNAQLGSRRSAAMTLGIRFHLEPSVLCSSSHDGSAKSASRLIHGTAPCSHEELPPRSET